MNLVSILKWTLLSQDKCYEDDMNLVCIFKWTPLSQDKYYEDVMNLISTFNGRYYHKTNVMKM